MPECVMEQACAAAAAASRDEEEEEEVAAQQPIYLEPFLHQVGGHSGMLRFDATTVCKPLVPREQCFYETMPPEMKEFTPQYRGVTRVQFAEDSEGYLTLVAYPVDEKSCERAQADLDGEESSSGGDSPASDDDDATQSDSDTEAAAGLSPGLRNRPRQRFRIRRSGSIEMETSKKFKTKVHNPWYLRCYKVQLEKMRKSGMDTDSHHKFILLENLASEYKWPCILDLKMGTRQHGDDASEEKRLLHTHKCQASTSGSLGTRICGMQSYQAVSGTYVCRDKYYGRTLDEAGMRGVLGQFVHNGLSLRRDVIRPLLRRLCALHRVLATLHTYRFYSSSLLLMYDGEPVPACYQCTGHDTPATGSSLSQHDTDTEDNKHWNAPPCPHRKPPRVDIRMIDFAHVTHKGFRGDKIVHNGPDHGYLFGLKNLIQMFEDILQHGGNGLEETAVSNGQESTSHASTSK